MTNDSVRKELRELISNFGIKQRFVANKVDLSDTTISFFVRDKRDLPIEKLKEIHKFCTEGKIN